MVNAWVLARSDRLRSWRFFTEALASDLHDVQGGTTAEGIHLGAMAGTVDIVMRCLTGMRARGPVLRFDPALPPQVKQLKFSVHYRGQRIDVELAEAQVRLSSRPGGAQPIQVLVHDQTIELAPGQEQEVPLGRPLPSSSSGSAPTHIQDRQEGAPTAGSTRQST